MGAVAAGVGEEIRRLREQKDKSLAAFSTENGFAKSFIWKIETGRVSPTVDYLQRIADALGVAITDLFSASPESTAAQGPQARHSRKTRAKAPA